MQLRNLIILVLTFSFIAKGETSTTGQNPTANLAAAASPSAESYLPPTPDKLPSPPPIQESQPPQQQADRKGGQSGASAAAAAAAGIAAASCMMMMNEARKMPPGPEKNMMMMMAMQQCAQAAQNAANAAQNKEGAQQLTQNDVPKQAQMGTPQQIQAPKSSGEQNLIPQAATEEEEDEEPENIDDILNGYETPGITLNSEKPAEEYNPSVQGNAASFSALSPLEKAKQTMDEGAGPDNRPIDPNMGSFNLGMTGSSLSPDALKKLAATEGATAIALEGAGGGRRPTSLGGGDGGGFDGGGGSSGSGDGNSPFDQMLSQMLGGSQGGDPGAMHGGISGSDFANIPTNSKQQPKINIFQYASYRYQFATYNDGRVQVRPTKTNVAPALAEAR